MLQYVDSVVMEHDHTIEQLRCIFVFSIPNAPSISHPIIRLSLSSNVDTMTIEV